MIDTKKALEEFDSQYDRWSTTEDPEVIAAALKFAFVTTMMISANNDPLPNPFAQRQIVRKLEALFEKTGEGYIDAVNDVF